MKPPVFVEDIESLLGNRGFSKLWVCPLCGRFSTLNWHGFIYGYDDDAEVDIRAARLFCSDRRKSNPGCGGCFCIRLSRQVPLHTVCASALWRLLVSWLHRESVHQAWLEARTGFSVESTYRWVKQLSHFQARLRELLLPLRAPPKSKQTDALKGLLEHLQDAFESQRAIQTFQMHFQFGWFK